MRKFIATGLLLLVASSLYAAGSLFMRFTDTGEFTDPPSAPVNRLGFVMLDQGTDVPGGLMFVNLSVTVSSSTTPAQLVTAIVTATQNDATSRGFTVPTGSILLPTYAAH